MNNFERALAFTFGETELAKVQRVKIGIAGAGGLGSNCAQYLVRSGFKKIRLVDFDLVEYSNLNRQFFFISQVGEAKVTALKTNLIQINPDLQIEALQVKISPENVSLLFIDCDVIVEAFDKPQYKKLLIETYLKSGKLLVGASGLAGWGKTDDINVHRMKENIYIIGDLETGVNPDSPPVAPGVNVAAAKQADVVLSHFIKKL